MAFALAACAGTDGATTSLQGTPAQDPVTTTSSEPGTSVAGATETTSSGRPPAPDFTLELGGGGSYTLSEGEKPVYLVFWAEW